MSFQQYWMMQLNYLTACLNGNFKGGRRPPNGMSARKKGLFYFFIYLFF